MWLLKVQRASMKILESDPNLSNELGVLSSVNRFPSLTAMIVCPCRSSVQPAPRTPSLQATGTPAAERGHRWLACLIINDVMK